LPTILNNYPQDGGTTISNDTAFITLFSDNINKVPRDLKEVGPQQLQFSSSVNLFARVTNTAFSASQSTTKQYQPSTSPDTVTLIGTRDDIGVNLKIDGTNYTTSPFFSVPKVYILGDDTADPIKPIVRNVGSNPYIAKVSTQNRVGAIGATTDTVTFKNTRLNVYETEPFESNLDIFWETSSSGVISNLNENIIASSSAGQPFKILNWVWSFLESDAPGTFATELFDVSNSASIPLASSGTVTAQLINVSTPSNAEVGGIFELVQEPSPSYKWKIKVLNSQVFTNSSISFSGNWSFTIKFTNTFTGEIFTNTLNNSGNNILGNATPTLIKNAEPNLVSQTSSTLWVSMINAYGGGAVPVEITKVYFQILNGLYNTGTSLDLRSSDGVVITISKVQIALYTQAIGGGFNTTIVDYKPGIPISNYIRMQPVAEKGASVKVAPVFADPFPGNSERLFLHNLQYNNQLTAVNPFGTNEQQIYNGTPQSTQFIININVKDASGGPGFKEINEVVNFTLTVFT